MQKKNFQKPDLFKNPSELTFEQRRVYYKKRRRIQLIVRTALGSFLALLLIFQVIRNSPDRGFTDDASAQTSASDKKHETDTSDVSEATSTPTPEETVPAATIDPEIAEILSHPDLYPARMLEDLERNPEMLDFVKKYPSAEAAVTGGLTEKEKARACPLFLQWDARWGYAPYGDDIIGLSGCGPTCLSMVIFSLTRNEQATPDALCTFAMEGSHYAEGTGTAWTLMTEAAAHYGIAVQEQPFQEDTIKALLDEGQLIICSVGAGDFTDKGHFIVIRGYNKTGFLINDPFSRSLSRKKWSFKRLQPQILNCWSYSKTTS